MADYGNGDAAQSPYQLAREHLEGRPYRWLISGVAGFIGSHLLETLRQLNQQVTGLDNFMTGHRHNLDQVRGVVGPAAWRHFDFIEGDIRDADACRRASKGADFLLHHAALGAVPRSLSDPVLSNDVNVGGFLRILTAARDAGVRRVIYASSSAVYGDHPALPKLEARIGAPLSPYAVTKCVNELYAQVYARCYGMETMGLRYFNVFGPRQDPDGAYAAVIARWLAAMLRAEPLTINGDGESSRDFCYVGNAVQANLLAALCGRPAAINQLYNIAAGASTSLNALYDMLRALLAEREPRLAGYLAALSPHHADFRDGDVRHSQADIAKAVSLLGYAPTRDVARGLKLSARWYAEHLAPLSLRGPTAARP